MSFFKESVVKGIEEAKNNLHNCIPLGFERLEEDLPGLIKENYTIITASSAVGKSKFAIKKYILDPYNWLVNNETDLEAHFFVFLLEESKTKFFLTILSNLLATKYNIYLSIKELKSIRREPRMVTPEVLEKINSFDKWFEKFEEKVEVIDNTRNAFGIHKTVREYCMSNGIIVKEKKIVEGHEREVDVYKPRNPNKFTISLVDNINLLHPELITGTKTLMTLHQAMSKHSSEYNLTLRDKFKCTLVDIQQQEAGKEKQEYYKGQSIESKLEPSLDGLGDNKLTQRNANEVIGLFAPDRYELRNHLGYDITKLGDNYRGLSLLKTRDGEANVKIGLYFNGKITEYRELPEVKEFDKDNSLYNKILNYE